MFYKCFTNLFEVFLDNCFYYASSQSLPASFLAYLSNNVSQMFHKLFLESLFALVTCCMSVFCGYAKNPSDTLQVSEKISPRLLKLRNGL